MRARRRHLRGATLAPAPDHDGLGAAATSAPDPAHLEALAAAGVDPAAAVRIGEGWFAVAYRAGDRVVRALKPEATASGGVEGYEREVGLLQLLGKRGLPVQRDARALRAEDGRLLGTVGSLVGGTPIRDLRLRRKPRARLARELAAFLGAVHATPLREARALGIPELDLGTELYAPMVREALALLRPRSREWIAGRLDGFLAAGGSAGAPRLPVHGDLGDAHILTNADGSLLGVLDLAEALIADPAFDAAALVSDLGWSFVELVLASYEGPATVDADFRRRAGFYADAGPLYPLVYGARLGSDSLLALGRRQIAARAAAATRAGR